MMSATIPYRLAVQQRVLPLYRVPFFDALAEICQGGLAVLAGQPRTGEAIEPADGLNVTKLTRTKNLHFFGGAAYLFWQRGVLAWLDAWQPHALVLEANPRNLSNPRAVSWMHARRRPVIGWGLGAPAISGAAAALRAALRRRYLDGFDVLVAYSRRGAEEFCAQGFPPERVFVAPNVVVPRPARPPERAVEVHSPATLLFVGRLQTRKRVDFLLRACAALPAVLRPRLRIVGDGPARPDLEKLAREVYPRAEFVGALHGPELDAQFDAADLFVLPGTGGLAVQQAMAHALPVVAAEADGTQEDLVRPANGWRVPPGDPEALTAVLRQALSDPARLRQMGRESYRIVAEEANLETMVAAFADAIKAAVRSLG